MHQERLRGRLDWVRAPEPLDRRRRASEVTRVIETPENELPDWAGLVLASARPPVRGLLEGSLRLDARLGRICLTASEPALAQLRLAWWRDELSRERADTPPDPLLASLLEQWGQDRSAPIALIDGWEELVGDLPPGGEAADRFAAGREAVFAAIAEKAGCPAAAADASVHGRTWARADLAAFGLPGTWEDERLPSLPRRLRPLAMIGGLARRAILRGGKPMFGDRMSPLVALRLGIFGT